MKATKEDRRVRLTKAALRQSLLTLLKEQPLSKITVMALCANAGINRGTFYAHYKGPADLLATLETALEEAVREALDASDEGEKDYVLCILRAIKANEDVCAAILRENADAPFLRHMMEMPRARTKALLFSSLGLTAEQEEQVYAYVVCGCMGLARHWLLVCPDEPAEAMATLVRRLIDSGLSAFVPS